VDSKQRLDELITQTLYEQDPEEEEDDTDTSDKDAKNKEKDKDVDKKELSSVDKKDLDDEEGNETDDDEEIVAAIKFDDNKEEGGQIRLLNAEKLSSMTSIENILKLFKIDPENVPQGFKDKMEITINSPLSDFKDDEYKILLMDKIGQISIKRPDFKTTITKKSKGNLGQEVQNQIGGGEEVPGAEGAEEKPAEEVDLSYLPELDTEFARAVKAEFFDRILQR
jgi:hypothetical protein